jgi:hypothetical protein
MTEEEIRITKIELALAAHWKDDNSELSMFFMPMGKAGERGQLDILTNSSIRQIKFEVFIRDGNPFIRTINEASEELEYDIVEIDTATKVLRLKNLESQKELSFRHK